MEDFFINRFGTRLYRTFFKDYTEKVWGVPCKEISAEWGAQRIKGLSVAKAIRTRACETFSPARRTPLKKGTETSLIERFLYPKFGPGQMWEEVARRVAAARRRHPSAVIEWSEWNATAGKITAVNVLDEVAQFGPARALRLFRLHDAGPRSDRIA